MKAKAKIIIVDDDPTNMLILATALRQEGYEVIEAVDGDQALAHARNSPIDIILLDLMLPGRDGIDICRELKANETTAIIPVIFVTAITDTQKLAHAFAAGGCDYITKPFRIEEILARVSVQLVLLTERRKLIGQKQHAESTAQHLRKMNKDLSQQARYDSLTKVLTRRAWKQGANVEHSRSKRTNNPYAVLMIDVDHFKSFNDTLGHPAGDNCLLNMAQAMSSACRSIDLIGRYGGEEFVVLLSGTDLLGAKHLAERIRQAVWDLGVNHPASPAGRVTVSIGLAINSDETLDEVITYADQALYKAKASGRNAVCAYSSDEIYIAAPDTTGAPHNNSRDVFSVLIVDDDITSRLLCQKSLEKEGYHVRTADCGVQALEMIHQAAPHVIVMDVVMPQMDGLACARAIRANPETGRVPIILMSARVESPDILAGLEAGADEYLLKPIHTPELIVRVRSMALLHRERIDLLTSYQMRADQIRVLTELLDFCRALAQANDDAEILSMTVDAVTHILSSRQVAILVPDEKREQLTLAKFHGKNPDDASVRKVEIGKGITGMAFLMRTPIVCNTEKQRCAKWSVDDEYLFSGSPLVSVSLIMAGEVIGVMNISDRVLQRPFEVCDLEYIEIITGLVATSLHGFRYRIAKEEARDLILVSLAKLAEHRDDDTAQHVDRVTIYSRLLAEDLEHSPYGDSIDENFIRCLERAVPLHDIGKVAIPDSILRKPGKLTVEEMAIMRTHADIGAATLQPIIERAPDSKFLQMAIDIIRTHHEWYDGSGYPKGLRGQSIPLSGRIVALVDVYDALTTKRVYKDAFSHEKAVAIIKELSGKQFDEVIVTSFLRREASFAHLAEYMADIITAANKSSNKTTPRKIANPTDGHYPTSDIKKRS